MSSVYVVHHINKGMPRVFSTLRLAANSILEHHRWVQLSDGCWVANTSDGMLWMTECEIERGTTRGKYAKKEC